MINYYDMDYYIWCINASIRAERERRDIEPQPYSMLWFHELNKDIFHQVLF